MTSPLCNSSCTGDTLFDPSKSSSFFYNGTTWEMTYEGDAGVSGIFAKEIVNIGGIHVINQTIGPLEYEIEGIKFGIPLEDIVGDPIEGDEENCMSSIGGNTDSDLAWIIGIFL
ncbi:9457_t:CDS:2 [Acaulospora colombiana]|uniref:9457_t:CDS:1 n=1 Tax=Acaulospora colombiana TaxID=27376 RepID=A0ACA9JX65_9GLOM|nr:9457_t:CDS:2 [Acaulospora colombiana]